MRPDHHRRPSTFGRLDILSLLVVVGQVTAFLMFVAALNRLVALPVWEACVIAAPVFFLALSGIVWLLLCGELNRPPRLPKFLTLRNCQPDTDIPGNPGPSPMPNGMSTASSILHFQRMILSPKSGVVDILRVAGTISDRLGLADITKWIQLELNGYGDRPVPNYRTIKGGSLQVLNPSLGWRFVGHHDLNFPLSHSIPELDSLLRQGSIVVPAQISLTSDSVSATPAFPRQVVLPSAAVNNVILKAKALVLDWTIELGRRGIVGRNLAFDEHEKQSAQRERFDLQDKIAHLLVNGANGVPSQSVRFPLLTFAPPAASR